MPFLHPTTLRKTIFCFFTTQTAPIARQDGHCTRCRQQARLSQFSALMNSFNVHQFPITLSPFNDRFQAPFPISIKLQTRQLIALDIFSRNLKPICDALLNGGLSYVNEPITACAYSCVYRNHLNSSKNLWSVNKCTAGSTLDRTKIVQHKSQRRSQVSSLCVPILMQRTVCRAAKQVS